MKNDNTSRIREKILALIDAEYESDAAFERAFDIPEKTVNNWRRGRSSSFMKILPELSDKFRMNIGEIMDIPVMGDSSELSESELASIKARAKGSEVERLYLEYINYVIKYYAVYQGVTITEEDVQETLGTMEEVLIEGLFSITEINVQQYLYENNTWKDKTP